jgi:CheY-like chemotaxis protein
VENDVQLQPEISLLLSGSQRRETDEQKRRLAMRVLLIDDDAAVRMVIRLILEKSGFEVTEASDGKSGIRTYQTQPADVVLCDLFMPGMDGLEVMQELRREFPDARIVAISGGGFQGTVDMLPAARVLGAAAILYKPLGVQQIRAAIHQALQTTVADLASHRNSEDPGSPDNGLIPGPRSEVATSLSASRGDFRRVVTC